MAWTLEVEGEPGKPVLEDSDASGPAAATHGRDDASAAGRVRRRAAEHSVRASSCGGWRVGADLLALTRQLDVSVGLRRRRLPENRV